MYDPNLVKPMREELTRIGVVELTSAQAVDEALSSSDELSLVVVNSVCGCAAGGARPAVALAMAHPKRPKNVYTVFAGQDREATERARSYFLGYPPSSPCFALMKGTTILEMIPRHEIEGFNAEQISKKIIAAFEAHL